MTRRRKPDDRQRRPLKKAARTSHLVRATQAADELGLPYTTLRQLAFQGEFPVVKIGRAWYLRRLDLEAFISRQLRKLAS
jgi:excisionase family DNA binding protein